MLTPEQLKQMDEIAGVKTPTIAVSGAQAQNMQVGKTRAAEIREMAKTARATQRKTTRSISEKILDFTGGKEIAQGLGQKLASKKNQELLDTQQNQQFSIQAQLLKTIKEKKAKGEDTTRLQKALDQLGDDIDTTGSSAERTYFNENELTDKQVIGDAVQLATTASAGKIAGTANKIPIKGVGAGMGALKGATTGVIAGTATGALEGAAQGLQKDKDAKGILKEAGKGALIGGAAGGVLGGTVGAVSGGVKASKAAKAQEHLNAITPSTKDMTATEYSDLVRKGKISPKTSRNPDQYILSPEEKEVATKYKSLLGKDPVKNTHNLLQEIEKKDKEVGAFLKKKNPIFNTGELKNSLTKKLADIDDLTVDEKRLAKLKKSTVDNFVKGLKKNDMESLWKARKEFDRTIEASFRGSPTLQKEIKKEFRNAVQDFISERTDDVTYKAYMKDMRELFKLADVTDTKAFKEKGMNAIQTWIKRNPTKAKLIGWTAGTGIVGTVGASVLNN